ncbi:MAG: hypothetical protein K9W44_02670 [Candidatus Lokiarchaeota archaeon]|nr:hypothetical protein [Candidatus Harpocratesius repetitus]
MVEKKNSLLKEKTEEKMWESIYSQIENEIQQKNLENLNSKITNDDIVFCKICGNPISPMQITNKCIHCGLPTCKECRSNLLCVYCFLNLKPFAQKSLKITRAFIFLGPLLFFFSTILFLNYIIILKWSAIIFILFTILYIFILFSIVFLPNRFFDQKWEKIIESNKFKAVIKDKHPKKFISEALYQDFQILHQKRINKLQNWVNQTNLKFEAPIPLYLQNEEGKLDENAEKEFIKNVKMIESKEPTIKPKKSFSSSEKNFNFCPRCKNKFSFGTFCERCNKKFCPECQIDTDLFSTRCICGYHYPDIFIQFKKKINHD